jgi:hypothetical protein
MLKLTCELVTEWSYRVTERLGITCDDRIPSPAKLAQAEAEANEWLEQELVYNAIDAELPL